MQPILCEHGDNYNGAWRNFAALERACRAPLSVGGNDAVGLQRFHDAVKNQASAHGGNKEPDDARCRVDTYGADPRRQGLSVSQARVRHEHGRHDGRGNDERVYDRQQLH